MARIVVVEDDLYMREELIDLLRKSDYEALPLLDFENAVSQIAALAPDLILLDLAIALKVESSPGSGMTLSLVFPKVQPYTR